MENNDVHHALSTIFRLIHIPPTAGRTKWFIIHFMVNTTWAGPKRFARNNALKRTAFPFLPPSTTSSRVNYTNNMRAAIVVHRCRNHHMV